MIGKVADSPLSVLITGESGTGKELAARTIHYNSSRFGKPFIAINCAALPESLLESELFGIEKGVATGVEKRAGKIETANGGTLFLDEIGDMSLPAQGKLLRALQERRLERVGGRSVIEVDVRVLAATNKDLKKEIEKGIFREDLYYRLNVVRIHMPALREMKEDIPLLAQYFLSGFANELGSGSICFSSEAMHCLVNYGWPGNVRELENEVKQAAILTERNVIDAGDLSENVRGAQKKSRDVLRYSASEQARSLKEAVEEFEIRLIKETLEKNRGNKQKTSETLGLTRQGLIKKIKKYEERIPASKSVEIDEQNNEQENKGAHGGSVETVRFPMPRRIYRRTSDGSPHAGHKAPEALRPDSGQAERRNLTVMFCDLVGFTAISEGVDPEDLREAVRAYLEVCSKIIGRFEGRIAKYFGDGMLVCFGYPLAHEDDAQRAVKAGLEIVEATSSAELSDPHPTSPLLRGRRKEGVCEPLQVRVGIHTGLVVIGEMGIESMTESIAIVGEAPNVAAQILNVADPDTVVISSAAYRLVERLFEYHYLGLHTLKGFSAPLDVYRVLRESGIRSRFEVSVAEGLTPLVGREREVELLLAGWERIREGEGQVVLINGEPGIGKSRLLRVLREQMTGETHAWLKCRCSPYYRNSPFYPVIDLLERTFEFRKEDSAQEKFDKLEMAIAGATLAPAPIPGQAQELPLRRETVSLFASLLSLPLPALYPTLNFAPQKQKEKILEALLAWIMSVAEKQPVLFVMEDLHWVDPSTLDFLNLLVDHAAESRIFALLTFRPEFDPPWTVPTGHPHLTNLTLSRLDRKESEMMVQRVAGEKTLPAEALNQIIAKTDGIPLFVEELTRMVLERYVGAIHESPLPPLAIPATLQDSLMARLDRLTTVKEVAQLGATIGREFTYELLQAVSTLDETALQSGLDRLVEADLLHQTHAAPASSQIERHQTRYFFKHALIQDAAYQSLLKSKRRQYHRNIAEVMEKRFPETAGTQPELLAHHYTEADLKEQAIVYWQKAGQRDIERSANVEAINHLTKGLDLLMTLPDGIERLQQELNLQTALGLAFVAAKGYGAPEGEAAFTRARELCEQLGESPHLLPVLFGLTKFYVVRADLRTACEMGEQLLNLARRLQDPASLIAAHTVLGMALLISGETTLSRPHLEEAVDLYGLLPHTSLSFRSGEDLRVTCLTLMIYVLWYLGYPDQALKRIREALTLATELSHPLSLAFALGHSSMLHLFRREEQLTRERAEAVIALSTEEGFLHWMAVGTFSQGWALAEQGQAEKGIAQMRRGLAGLQAAGSEITKPWLLALLAEVYGKIGRVGEGLTVMAEALAVMHKNGEYYWEAEIYRLRGELLLKSAISYEKSINLQSEIRNPQSEAESCFRQAIDVARRQSAKSLELRAVMSLSRLLQKQGEKEETRRMLAEIYGWFTEGFDTRDLKESKALLEELLK